MAQNKFWKFITAHLISLISLFSSIGFGIFLFFWNQQSATIVTAQTIQTIQNEQKQSKEAFDAYKNSQEKTTDEFKVELKSIRENMATSKDIDEVKTEQKDQRDMIFDIWKSRAK